MTDAAAIIGKAIGKPKLGYVQLPSGQVKPAFMQMGMSASVADLFLEMSSSLNSGHICALEARSGRNTTPTSYEDFVAKVFVPAYHGRGTAA
jgi:hypothetical protein